MSFKSLRNLGVLCVSCGVRLNLHNRRDAEDAELARRLEAESAPIGFEVGLSLTFMLKEGFTQQFFI